MITKVTAIIGAVGVVASLVFVAIQTRFLARQTQLSNSIGAASLMQGSLTRLHELQMEMLNRPELIKYFYEGAEPPPTDTIEHAQLLVTADTLADSVDYGLMVVELMPRTRDYEGWKNYATFLWQNSPMFRNIVHQHPDWYVGLNRFVQTLPPQSPSADSPPAISKPMLLPAEDSREDIKTEDR